MDSPEKLASQVTQDKKKPNTMCVGHHYPQANTNNIKVALEANFVCLDYQSLKEYFSKSTKWKLNILVSMCFWRIALYCTLNFIFQIHFNQRLCNIMRKKLGYALWLKIAYPGQITHQQFLFPLQDITTAYTTVSQNFDIWFHSFMSYSL